MKIAALVSHAIQYQAPLFKKLSTGKGVDLTIYFCWDFGTKKTYDAQFGQAVEWDIPLLEGYKYKLLKNYSSKPSSDFWGQVNPGIVREIFKNKYDAIWIAGWNSFTNWLAFFAAIISGTPILLRGENPFIQEARKKGLRQALKRFILRGLFAVSSALLFIGEENRKFYKYLGVPDRKLFFVPYAADNERFMGEARKLAPGKEEFKKDMGIAPEKTTILFTGKLMPKKRPMDLLRAYAEIKNENKALVYVGDGALRKELENFVKEKEIKDVHFVGFKNQLELGKFYALADIFVLPSGAGETWGLVVNEAMCFSLPVIVSSEVGCAPDLVRQGKNGFIFPLGDIGELSERLEFLVKNKGSRNSFGRESARVVGGYDFQQDKEGILGAVSFAIEKKV